MESKLNSTELNEKIPLTWLNLSCDSNVDNFFCLKNNAYVKVDGLMHDWLLKLWQLKLIIQRSISYPYERSMDLARDKVLSHML